MGASHGLRCVACDAPLRRSGLGPAPPKLITVIKQPSKSRLERETASANCAQSQSKRTGRQSPYKNIETQSLPPWNATRKRNPRNKAFVGTSPPRYEEQSPRAILFPTGYESVPRTRLMVLRIAQGADSRPEDQLRYSTTPRSPGTAPPEDATTLRPDRSCGQRRPPT